jgi:hypothetical protein
VSILRGVQFALEHVENVRTVPEDEGESPDTAVAALDRLAGQGARAVIGVARDDLSAAVSIRAQALGIELWLIAPAEGVEGAGARVHVAGPSVSARADALVAAARAHGARATLELPTRSWDVHERLERQLAAAGIAVTRNRVDDLTPQITAGGLHVVAGLFGREARAAFNRAAERAPTQWIFEARVALPGGEGTWVGMLPGPAFPSLLATYCERIGEPPDEFALMGHDAARAVVSAMRGDPAMPTALDPSRTLVAAVVSRSGPTNEGPTNGRLPAAASRCPANPPP